jgi:Mce-associated membrane protein
MRLPTALAARLPRRRTPDRPPRRQAPDRPQRRRSMAIPTLAAATVLAAGAAGAGWYADHRADQRDTAVRQATATASAAAKAVFSYDYRTFDTSIANGRTFVTGAFADEYAETTTALKQTATKQQAVVLAEVATTGVVSAAPDRVELLVYLNQYRRNVSTAGQKLDQNRVVLTMVPVGGEWKISGASAV